jgi:nitrogen fixation NifU-like protein
MTTRDLRSLYQELILEHGKAPRNEGPLDGATCEATTKNPLCGDRVTVRLVIDVDGERVTDARFEARGCMIARASASLLTESIRGQSVQRAVDLASAVDALVAGPSDDAPAELGALAALGGVREFPARRACVTLAWKALEAALAGRAHIDRQS